MILKVDEFNSSVFTHLKDKKVLICEASELQLNRFCQLYDDACDIGIALKNEKTNNVTRWFVCESETLRDPEGDVIEWRLYPTTETVSRVPAVAGYMLRIIND